MHGRYREAERGRGKSTNRDKELEEMRWVGPCGMKTNQGRTRISARSTARRERRTRTRTDAMRICHGSADRRGGTCQSNVSNCHVGGTPRIKNDSFLQVQISVFLSPSFSAVAASSSKLTRPSTYVKLSKHFPAMQLSGIHTTVGLEYVNHVPLCI